ncbi:MAG TPA: hypothetical protein DCO77_12395, partial [Nitrospiraceae bacterium]|nr:hypothetical protein [Nitrospiraceae bacterium]
MPEIGEGVAVGVVKKSKAKYISLKIVEITFQSGNDIYDIDARGTEQPLPPAGTPHWGSGTNYPAVYVRKGGTGETVKLKIKVKWQQRNCDGSAKLEGKSADGKIVIQADFSISGERGEVEFECKFSKKPDRVM